MICLELNLPVINLPVPGQTGSLVQNGGSTSNTEATGSESREKENGGGNDAASDVQGGGTDTANQSQLYQDSSIYYHFRDMQRRQVEFVKKRVLLLEKGLNAEYQKEYFVSSKLLKALVWSQVFKIWTALNARHHHWRCVCILFMKS